MVPRVCIPYRRSSPVDICTSTWNRHRQRFTIFVEIRDMRSTAPSATIAEARGKSQMRNQEEAYLKEPGLQAIHLRIGTSYSSLESPARWRQPMKAVL